MISRLFLRRKHSTTTTGIVLGGIRLHCTCLFLGPTSVDSNILTRHRIVGGTPRLSLTLVQDPTVSRPDGSEGGFLLLIVRRTKP